MKYRKLVAAISAGLIVFASTLAAQDVEVTAADPPAAEQGTFNLDVKITGKGFKQGARSAFFVTGTTNPGGIVVKSTRYVSPTQLIANIDVAETAELSKFDIEVQLTSGRTGKGIELFTVVAKGNACVLEPLPGGITLLGTLNNGPDYYRPWFGSAVAARMATLGGRQVVVAAVGTILANNVEMFFLDPDTGAVLDGQVIGSATARQPHITNLITTADCGADEADMGDVNRDGFPDIAVADTNRGSVHVFLSSLDAQTGVLTYGDAFALAQAGAAQYGSSIAFGDLNGLPGDELVVGARGGLQYNGSVLVYAFNGISFNLVKTIADPAPNKKKDAWFGQSVAVGDVAGGNDNELIVGAANSSKELTQAGRVYVFLDPLGSNPPSLVLSGTNRDDRLGYQVAVAEVDGQPVPDLVAATDWNGPAVRALLYPGPVSSGASSTQTWSPRLGYEGGWATSPLATEDLNGDGKADVLIGAGNATCGGAMHLYLTGDPQSKMLQAPEPDPWFYGWSVAAVPGTRLFLVGEKGRHLPPGGLVAGQVYVYKVD